MASSAGCHSKQGQAASKSHCDRAFSTNQPALDGFDVVAFELTSRQAITDLTTRWDDLDIPHTGLRDLGTNGVSVDVADPDGTVLRFLYDTIVGRDGFVGVATETPGQFTLYDNPKFT